MNDSASSSFSGDLTSLAIMAQEQAEESSRRCVPIVEISLIDDITVMSCMLKDEIITLN